MAGVAVMGHQAKFGTSVDHATGDTAAVTQPFEFISRTGGKRGTIIGGEGISGTRSAHSERTRTGPYTVSNNLVLEPSSEELATWLPRILGTAASGNNFTLGESLPWFNMSEDMGEFGVKIWGKSRVDKATFSSSGGMLRLSMDIESKTETDSGAGNFPAISVTHTASFIFEGDPVFTLVGSARELKDFEIVINNNLTKDHHRNSITRTDIPVGPRDVTVKVTVDANSTNADLYDQALLGSGATIVFTNGGYSLTFTFGKLQAPAETPDTSGKGERLLTVNYTARMTGSTREVVVVLDSNPS